MSGLGWIAAIIVGGTLGGWIGQLVIGFIGASLLIWLARVLRRATGTGAAKP